MMEHLSSEERECLMFLEETIESLETENDGGVSNGGPARPSQYQNNKMAHLNSVRPVKPEGEYERLKMSTSGKNIRT